MENIKKNISFWLEQNDLCKDEMKNENILAFMGPTKAGKSTLINCLLKKQLYCHRDDATEESFIAKIDENDGGPKIGEMYESETLKPACYGDFDDTKLKLWDFPGFGDNRGSTQEVANAVAVKTVLCQQKSVKFVLVVPSTMIKSSDPTDFYTILNDVLKISPEIANHLILVASKKEKGNLEILLKKLIDVPFDKADSERLSVIKKAKDVINVVLKNKAFIEFKTPSGDEESYVLPNYGLFRDLLCAIEGVNVCDCNLVMSSKAELELIRLYDIVYSYLSSLIDEIVKLIDNEGNKIVSSILKKTSQNFDNDLNCMIFKMKKIKKESNSLVDLLTNLDTNREVVDVCKSLKDLEDLRNHCRRGHDQICGDREFKLKVEYAIDSFISKFNNSEKEKETMESKAREISLLSASNQKSISTQIWDFCLRYGPTIISTLVLAPISIYFSGSRIVVAVAAAVSAAATAILHR